MAHDVALKDRCEHLYVVELLTPKDICEATGVALATFYRWRDRENWERLRELEMGSRESLGKLLWREIKFEQEQTSTDANKLNSLINMYDRFQRSGKVRERIVFEGDAETLIETMREMDAFAALLDDPVVQSELGERLKEKRRHKE